MYMAMVGWRSGHLQEALNFTISTLQGLNNLEKNDSLGKKLLITGGGRCNLTNNEPDVRKFLQKFKDSDKFLFY